MVKETKIPTIKKPTIEDVMAAINLLNADIKKLIDGGFNTQFVNEPSRPAVAVTVRKNADSLPIPIEYVEIMEEVLNKKFDMEIKYMADTSAFDLSVLVPKEYSNAGLPHWEMYHEDRRSKVIDSALGITGVRDWMNQIYENFGQETKSKISYERSQI